jgi:hypothetical protein
MYALDDFVSGWVDQLKVIYFRKNILKKEQAKEKVLIHICRENRRILWFYI